MFFRSFFFFFFFFFFFKKKKKCGGKPSAGDERFALVGPRPFEKEDSDRFFGRTRETEELLSLIIAHRADPCLCAIGSRQKLVIEGRCHQAPGGTAVPRSAVRTRPWLAAK